MELRMQIDSEFMGKLSRDLNNMKATDVVREALTILNWAVQERQRGRVILSADPDGQKVARLAMLSLDAVANNSRGVVA